METAMHRQLKNLYGIDRGGQTEVSVAGYRIDAVDPEGTLVEVQSGGLSPLRPKLNHLLESHHVRVVKPVVVSRRIVRKQRPDGADLSVRTSPRRGDRLDVFEDLLGLSGLFPHPNLRVEVVTVAIDEVRIPRRRRPGYAVVDRRLNRILGTVTLQAPEDLWSLLPDRPAYPFTTLDVAAMTDRSIDFAQKIAYVLRQAGAIRAVGKRGNRLVYETAEVISGPALCGPSDRRTSPAFGA